MTYVMIALAAWYYPNPHETTSNGGEAAEHAIDLATRMLTK